MKSSADSRSINDKIGSAFGQVEEALRESLADDPHPRRSDLDTDDCDNADSAACASCGAGCTPGSKKRKQAKIVYYDDEELDSLALRPIESYTPEEIEALREVATTLHPTDRDGWLHSMAQRKILLPPEILQLLR